MIVTLVPGFVAATGLMVVLAVVLDLRDHRRAQAGRDTLAAHRADVRGRHFPGSRPPYDQDDDEDQGTAA